jgi:hypothetical protein
LASLLPSLYKEYTELTTKLTKLTDLISEYGGEIPSNTKNSIELPPKESTPLPQKKAIIIDSSYPEKGSWKSKILFALKFIGKPSTVIELENFILEKEASENPDYIHRTVTQYTSTLAKSGDIDVDKSDFRSKYSLKP